jgi:(2S)-methylsuccinyl-CoA dehydrogenase
MTPSNSLLAEANSIVAQLRRHFGILTAELATACSTDGVLSAKALDLQQIPSYELALAGAELLAAETVLENRPQPRTELGLRLGLTYAVESMATVGSRLQRIALDLNWDTAALDALLGGGELRALRKPVLGSQALEETGRLLCDTSEEIGGIELGDELSMAQAEFRRFAAQVVAPLAKDIHCDDLLVPESILTPLREMGVFGLSIPEAYGGSAPNDRDDTLLMIVVTEALAEASLAAAGSLITRPEILSRALLAGGTEDQKSAWLPKIAAGNPLCAIAITEPDFGSDVAALQLKGRRVSGGWLLNGAKTWCTFAGKAGVIMTVVRTEQDRSLEHRGLSICLVEKPAYEGYAFDFEQASGGRLVGKAIPTIGYRGMHSFDLSFQNLFVPDANVIGGESGLGNGFYYTMAGMVGGRIQTAARASGVMRAALLAAVRYAKDRKVFNAPLANYALTRAKLAGMAARFVACRELTYAFGRRLDAGGGRMEASLIKLFACRSAEWLTREALQIHGGMGYAEETPISRYFVDARVLSIFEGAEETLALKVVARSMFENALKHVRRSAVAS